MQMVSVMVCYCLIQQCPQLRGSGKGRATAPVGSSVTRGLEVGTCCVGPLSPAEGRVGCPGEQEAVTPPAPWNCSALLLLPGFRGAEEEPWLCAALGTDRGCQQWDLAVKVKDFSKSVCTMIFSKDIIRSQ